MNKWIILSGTLLLLGCTAVDVDVEEEVIEEQEYLLQDELDQALDAVELLDSL